jgi:hypothetical protein
MLSAQHHPNEDSTMPQHKYKAKSYSSYFTLLPQTVPHPNLFFNLLVNPIAYKTPSELNCKSDKNMKKKLETEKIESQNRAC